ncbi:hypothetical protein B0H14DRAFT_3508258 [Mycena olivaceomarginata]|nr:hypothetical protein B0H14DRAFT_3508258 [Mycena olivaceomarginata]
MRDGLSHKTAGSPAYPLAASLPFGRAWLCCPHFLKRSFWRIYLALAGVYGVRACHIDLRAPGVCAANGRDQLFVVVSPASLRSRSSTALLPPLAWARISTDPAPAHPRLRQRPLLAPTPRRRISPAPPAPPAPLACDRISAHPCARQPAMHPSAPTPHPALPAATCSATPATPAAASAPTPAPPTGCRRSPAPPVCPPPPRLAAAVRCL